MPTNGGRLIEPPSGPGETTTEGVEGVLVEVVVLVLDAAALAVASPAAASMEKMTPAVTMANVPRWFLLPTSTPT
jgi:hypothetical protein